MMRKVTPVFTGSVTSAFTTIALAARKNSRGTTGYPTVR